MLGCCLGAFNRGSVGPFVLEVGLSAGAVREPPLRQVFRIIAAWLGSRAIGCL